MATQKHDLTHMISERTADAATLATAGFAGISLAQIETWVSIVAGVCAIVSACAATYYYIRKASEKPSDEE